MGAFLCMTFENYRPFYTRVFFPCNGLLTAYFFSDSHGSDTRLSSIFSSCSMYSSAGHPKPKILNYFSKHQISIIFFLYQFLEFFKS